MTDKITIRTPSAPEWDGLSMERALREVYYRTNNEHRLSLNGWYVEIFRAFLKASRGESK